MRLSLIMSGFCLFSLLPVQAAEQSDLPSRAMLEFLAEFDNVDEQTFELFEYHAKHDRQQAQETSAQENHDD